MANIDAAFGLRPYKRQGGGPMTHGLTHYRIQTSATAGTSSALYQGQLVILDGTTNFVAPAANAAGGTAAHIGVFFGCEYVDLTGKPRWSASFPGTAAVKANTDAWAYVYDDPDMLFIVNCDAAAALTIIGSNAQTATGLTGNTYGISAGELAVSTSATTATHPLRVIGFEDTPDNSDAASPGRLAIVRLNNHLHRTTTGI